MNVDANNAGAVPAARPAAVAARRGGTVLATTMHVVLLCAVLGQVVYLGSRHRLRFDATSDDQYSLTSSTRTILDRLDQRLIIEAYVSPKGDMPSNLRDTRTVLDNFLDELVQLGHGNVVVQRFNPIEDKTIQDKCTRIGVKAIEARTSSTNALEVKRHWQGLRLVYGTGRQKVIEQIGPRSTFMAEAVVTPAIKEVVTQTRKKIGYMEWPSDPQPGQQTPQGNGWNAVRSVEHIAKRYEFQNYKDAESTLVPDDVDTLLLFRPRDLTDRQKYVVDQFLLRGGTMVVFEDVADYAVAPRRQFNKVPLLPDAKDSKWKWQDQLLHYGVDVSGRLVGDAAQQAWRTSLQTGYEYFGMPSGIQGYYQQLEQYPYFFHCAAIDWAQVADQLAGMGGRKDPALVEYFKKTLRPGIDSDEFLFQAFKKLGRGPGFYWPCQVELRKKQQETVDLPPDVQGRVMLWSSPLALLEEPPPSLDPTGGATDRMQLAARYREFTSKINKRVESEPRRQAGLMVELKGRFPSFFAGKERPKRPAEIKEEEAKKKAAEEQANKPADDAGKTDKPAPDAKKLGPEPPKDAEQDKLAAATVTEPDPIVEAKAPGRLVVIGDSDFLRDDFVGASYAQAGGPVSIYGQQFFLMLLDWLAQDADLLALQSRIPVDRKLELAPQRLDRVEDPRDVERHLNAKTTSLIWVNTLMPCVVLLSLGLAVLIVRRSQKRAFLASVGN
jgi:ABC-type uncharacterized transport system involved in gliding motility auxiliary subunit